MPVHVNILFTLGPVYRSREGEAEDACLMYIYRVLGVSSDLMLFTE